MGAFPRLIADLLSAVYNLLFSGNAIQISDPGSRHGIRCARGQIQRSDPNLRDEETKTRVRPFSRLDLSSSSHKLLLGTTGAGHAKENSVADKQPMKILWQSDPTYSSARVDLSVQLLRTCRQIHNEAALIPYAGNCFVFLGGLAPDPSKPLERYIGLKQRQAIRSAAIFGVDFHCQHLNRIHRLLPGLHRLWIDVPLVVNRDRVTPSYKFNRDGTLVPEAIAYLKKRWEDETSQLKVNLEALGGLQLTSATVHLLFRSRGMQIDKEENRLVAESLGKILMYGKADNENDAEGSEDS